jgi:hypothetical protein
MVQDGDTICPAHYALYAEMGTIGRADRRIEMARLVDWLSGKVAIVPPEIQMQAELLFLIRSFLHKKDDLYPALHMVWDPISSIVGRPVPSIPSLPADIGTALQKDWCDFLSVFGLEDFFVCASNNLPAPNRWNSDFCKRQNEGAEAHRRDYKTFDEVFLIEIHGVLDALRPEIASAFHYLYTASGGRLSQEDIESADDDVLVRQFCGMIHEAYKQKKLSTQWPSLHIGAGIHAAKRYEQRLYQRGDWLDGLHAQAALPYCDVFMTERALGTLITGKYLGFDKAYACKVVWRDEDVLPALTHGS